MLNTLQIINWRKQNKHTSDTIIFGLVSLENPNAGKPMQLSEGFNIMQFLNTIWVLKPAHPTENNLGSSTSQLETDVPAETPDKHSDNFHLQFAQWKPQRLPLGTTSALHGLALAQ